MKIIKLENIAEVSAGQGAPQGDHSYSDDGLPFIKAGNLEDLIITNDEYKSCNLVNKETAKNYKLKLYPKDTLVFAKSGMSATKGRIYCLNNEAYVVNHLSVIIPNTKLIEPRYLKYFFYVFSPSRLIKDESYPSIGLGDIKKIDLLLPPLEDQKRIINILEQADVLRKKRKQAIELLDEYLKAVFLEMFGDPVKNPKGWKKQKLGEMIDFMTSGSRGWAKYYANSGDIFLRIQNVGQNSLKTEDLCFINAPETAESRRTKAYPGDVLLSITADLGRTAVIPKGFPNAHINQHLALLRFKDCFIPEYISEFLASKGGKTQIERLNKGGTKAGLNFNDIKSIQILIPDLNFQETYLARKNHVQKLKQKMLAQSEELKKQFQALMQKAFKGEL